MTFRKKLLEETRRDLRRLDNKTSHQTTWIGMLLYGGTLGLLFVIPVVAGAYIGHWLDTLAAGYSASWTLSLIILGVAVGGYNVFRFLQEK